MEIWVTDCDIRKIDFDFILIQPDGENIIISFSPFALQKITDFAYSHKILPIKSVAKILNIAAERKKIYDGQNET